MPLLAGGAIAAAVSFAVLALERRGRRRFELAIVALLALVTLGFAYDLAGVGADPGAAVRGLAPGFAGVDSVLLAVGIVGATVMPHVIYLHSALTARVASQVVLSFGIPFALIPLLMITRRADVMGPLRNRRLTTLAASGVAALVIGLNAFLIGSAILG